MQSYSNHKWTTSNKFQIGKEYIAPTLENEAAPKKFVDDEIAALWWISFVRDSFSAVTTQVTLSEVPTDEDAIDIFTESWTVLFRWIDWDWNTTIANKIIDFTPGLWGTNIFVKYPVTTPWVGSANSQTIFMSTPVASPSSGSHEFTHNLGVTQADVEWGRYSVMFTWMDDWTAFVWNSCNPAIEDNGWYHRRLATDASAQSTTNWQENTLKVVLSSDNANIRILIIDNRRLTVNTAIVNSYNTIEQVAVSRVAAVGELIEVTYNSWVGTVNLPPATVNIGRQIVICKDSSYDTNIVPDWSDIIQWFWTLLQIANNTTTVTLVAMSGKWRVL